MLVLRASHCFWAWVAFELVLTEIFCVEDDQNGPYLNEFAIRLKSGGRDVAEKIAEQHGFKVKRELPSINVFLLEHPHVYRSKRSADSQLQSLQNDDRIEHVQQEIALHRVKRNIVHDKQLELPIRTIEEDSLFARFKPADLAQRDNIYGITKKFSDPKFKDMWYLTNQGQSGGEEGMDMNVAVVWENGITGKGVVVCILDDGVDHTHPDLIDNYDHDASTDLNDKDDVLNDPMPDTKHVENSHGTRCAGEIAAAANNHVCGVGVAYEASIGGIRILDGIVTDALEAESITFNNNYIDIYSASWGPNDDGSTMEGPRHLALEAMLQGVHYGRNGLGSIFVWATGNGGMNQDDCSADGYVSRPETLSVGSVNDWGRSPFFMENCTSTLAVVPSGGEDYIGQEEDSGKIKLKVVTTDMNGGCIENFQGTSSAAPLAAGCLANVLQANPMLTWRDVQHIVVQGSRVPSVDNSWTINGAGHHVSHRFGFGLMDCGKMVELAQSWTTFPDQRMCNTTKKNYQILKKYSKIEDSMVVDGCTHDSQSIDRLEHVQVHIKMSSDRRGEIALILTSPAGTRSILLSHRLKDDYSGDWEFTFMTVHCWDESPRGKWTLAVHHIHSEQRESDHYDTDMYKSSMRGQEKQDPLKLLKQVLDASNNPVGYIKEWSLVLYGTHGTRHHRTDLNSKREQKAYYPTEGFMMELKNREVELSKRVQVKRAEIGQGQGQEKKSDIEKDEDFVIETLWKLLHSNGERVVRKRVLEDSYVSSKHQHKAVTSEAKEIYQLVNQVSNLLSAAHERKEDEEKERLRRKLAEDEENRRETLRAQIVKRLLDYLLLE